MKPVTFWIYCCVATLAVSTSHCHPVNSQVQDVFDLLNFKVCQEDPNEIQKEIDRITSEDWADSWDPPQELKEWFPYRIMGKTNNRETGNRATVLSVPAVGSERLHASLR